jgi:urease accessory protein
MPELTALLQLADAAFPAGTFAHSFGLETAIAEERVRDEASLEAWLRTYLRGSLATFDGAAFVLAARDEIAAELLDERLAAAQPNPELRRANAHLARATLATFAAIGLQSAALDAYGAAIDDDRCAGQHVLAAALGYRAAEVPWVTALTAHASTTVATLASVARVRWRLQSAIRAAVERAADARSVDDLAIGAPQIEIDGLRHRRLDGRLFAS